MLVTLASLMFPAQTRPAPADATPWEPDFAERPGALEFSGQMIVRPRQRDELLLAGRNGDEINAIRIRAGLRLVPDLIEFIPETDEYIVRVPHGQTENGLARRLMRTGDYQYVTPDWICFPTKTVPNDPTYPMQWYHGKIRSAWAWDHETGDPDVVIAIVDGGVSLTQPDLAPRLVPGYNAQDRLAQQDGGDVTDVDGHGTFIAGCAAATGNNGLLVAGIGWNLSIMPVRYYNSAGGGLLSNLLNGARWAADHGARVVNVSQTGVEFQTVQTTGQYVRSQGGLLVYAAGNDGRDLSWFDWDDVIVVGGTDRNDQLMSDSSVTSAFGLAVDLFAPGKDIRSTSIQGGVAIGTGTSAATGITSGLCGLLWSVHGSRTPDDIERFLIDGCVDLGPPGEDTMWGHGRISSEASMIEAMPPILDSFPHK